MNEWLTLLAAVMGILAMLYIPGYFAIRGLGASRGFALLLAPIVSLAGLGLLPILWDKVGIGCSVGNVCGVLFAICLAIGFVGWVHKRSQKHGSSPSRGAHARTTHNKAFTGADIALIALYIACGAVATTYVFVKSLDGAGSFPQLYDAMAHLNNMQAMYESGRWSSLGVSSYLTSHDMQISPYGPTGSLFYPAVWYAVSVLVMNIFGVSAALASNALVIAITTVVFPAGMFLLVRTIFDGARHELLYGSLCTVGFIGFPWAFLVRGPLWPNLLSYAAVPLVVSCFIMLVSPHGNCLKRSTAVVLVLVGCVALALSQPNAVFTVAIVLAPFLLFAIRIRQRESNTVRLVPTTVLRIVYLAAVCVAWWALFNAPFMEAVVNETWGSYLDIPQAIAAVFNLGYLEHAQWLLALFFSVGFVVCATRQDTRWLCLAYAIEAVAFIFCAATDGFAKQLLCGFWYTDPYRIAANCSLVAMPLAAAGLAHTHRTVSKALGNGDARTQSNTNHKRMIVGQPTPRPTRLGIPSTIAALAVMAIVAAANFSPTYGGLEGEAGTPFSWTRWWIGYGYTQNDTNIFPAEEQEFMYKVSRAVPHDAVVLNIPDDGSVFAYATNDIHTYYRRTSRTSARITTPESDLIRTSLATVAENEDLARILKDIGADYLVMLDYGTAFDKQRAVFNNDPDWFSGIFAVTDETPGFDIVLSEEDMRLYRITG